MKDKKYKIFFSYNLAINLSQIFCLSFQFCKLHKKMHLKFEKTTKTTFKNKCHLDKPIKED